MDDKVKKKIDELVAQADTIISSPETIEQLKAQGLPIKSVKTTYEQYLDKLFAEKSKTAKELIGKLPRIDENIANSTIQSLYTEIQECFVLGISGAAITLSMIMLELALKYRLQEERLKSNPNSDWSLIEQLDMTKTINGLKRAGAITPSQKKELDAFNVGVRNSYIHYNVQKLVSAMYITQLPALNIDTGEVTIEHNVQARDKPFLWFSAKKVLDRETVGMQVGYCVDWTNKILKNRT